jgi:hypothetical protein
MGAAGVHFVASELSLRGLIALPTIRNTAGIDIVVVNKSGTWQANLQVKTSRSKASFWPVATHYDRWRGRHNFYVFVRFLKSELRFEAFLESANRVAEHLACRVADEKKRGLKEWAPCWYLAGEEDRVRRQWDEFGIKEVEPWVARYRPRPGSDAERIHQALAVINSGNRQRGATLEQIAEESGVPLSQVRKEMQWGQKGNTGSMVIERFKVRSETRYRHTATYSPSPDADE